ncbi:TBC domain-containing protein kinase-like protein [Neocloeon triangulifer]|uniref:TBC domain-containing protein kinase-like protein n=1 Tax=Neocloeon triangulifer TaxID=2078957 RepID=UPI00286F801C|nr:TBC domain-containing protein kinase-like protein [Neocloeon triangulifer]
MAEYSGKVRFGATTFFAKSHSLESCGSNGLPLTPNSISILGTAQKLKTLKHPYLCSYLDVIRGKHERISVVCELFPKSLSQIMAGTKKWEPKEIILLMHQILKALAYLEENGVVHRALDPENILIGWSGEAKLFNYGLYYMTGEGKFVTFPIGQPRYLAPEVLLAGPQGSSLTSNKVDVWSLGMIGAELALGEAPSSPHSAGGNMVQLARSLRRVLSLVHCEGSVLERLARESGNEKAYENMDGDLKEILEACLSVMPSKRPSPLQLLSNKIFEGFQEQESLLKSPLKQTLRRDYLGERSLQEIFYLWQLAGGDVHGELRRQGLVRRRPPILSIGNLVLLEGKHFGATRDPATLYDPRVVPLPMESLYNRLENVPPESYFPLIETPEIGSWGPSAETCCLPLVIRERDTEYQFHRIILFDRLLKAWPHQHARILREAKQDVPPLYRAAVWAALLNAKGDIEGQYVSLDKETPTSTDRQIEVDIPRCHQYDELLSSAVGHLKFKRLLKAWVVGHPQYVYWQGIDSLCAPFLYLNFNNEARAYACLAAFVPKYLQGFFLQDNWAVVQEYLAVFARLTAFHEPVLAMHMREIAFVPELFAIPWFLTMFSHVFPLHKILPLWDRLLLGDSSFPLFIGLAILRQLRDTLLSSGFNECILLFSDLPDIDIGKCTTDSVALYCATPKSATFREHSLKTEILDTPMDVEAQSIAELKAELCPRISGRDFVELLEPTRDKNCLQIVDIRSTEEFSSVSFMKSVNIPYGDGANEPDLTMVNNFKGKISVIVSSDVEQAAKFAEILLENGIPRVCLLHNPLYVLTHCNELYLVRQQP